jgi:hypothetical protein
VNNECSSDLPLQSAAAQVGRVGSAMQVRVSKQWPGSSWTRAFGGCRRPRSDRRTPTSSRPRRLTQCFTDPARLGAVGPVRSAVDGIRQLGVDGDV